jgi:asparagine synthase (glutamine-hydrolysing)
MCGILAVVSKQKIGEEVVKQAQTASKRLSHRGPDESGVYASETAVLCHERLSIMDLSSGRQPLEGHTGAMIVHNGEIYNYKELTATLPDPTVVKTKSDSEVIVHLYEEFGTKIIHDLDGDFAFVIVKGDKVFAGRDPIGVKPLYYGHDKEGRIWFASESKALDADCVEIKEFLPGHYYTHEEGFVQYYKPAWLTGEATPTSKGEKLRELLTKAVRKRLMSDVPLGVLLSGGLDSSLVTSIVSKELKRTGKKIKSFSVGLTPESQDLVKARRVAKFLGTEHHEVLFTVEEGIAILPEMIHKLETYDITTIRASTPMYIMAKYIRSQGIKVVLSGEGADEIFGGYLYFHSAPSSKEFHDECVSRIKRLYTADVLRCDRATMGAGVEARVPFLDKEFMDHAMSIDPELKVITKQRMEKTVLRSAFDSFEDPYLPDDILWRQKEQFSDGVGYSWIDTLKAYAEKVVTDEEFAQAKTLYPHQTPETKEAFFYRTIYAGMFKHADSEKLVAKWIPKWQTSTDPSGRANTFHKEAYKKETKKSFEASA